MSSPQQTIALVTGANTGIGRAVAISLARDHHYTVIIGSRKLPAGEEVASSLTAQGHSAYAVQLDLTSDDSIFAAVRFIQERFGRLDVLVNNAGTYLDAYKPGIQEPPVRELFIRTFQTNVAGGAVLTDALLPLLVKSTEETGPRILWVSTSMSSLARVLDKSLPYYHLRNTAYVVSKTALNMLALKYVQFLERACGEGRGRSVVVCPGLVRTNQNDNWEAVPRLPEDGARWIVKVATDGKGEVENGSFTDENGVLPW